MSEYKSGRRNVQLFVDQYAGFCRLQQRQLEDIEI